jgi:hypothetical protein
MPKRTPWRTESYKLNPRIRSTLLVDLIQADCCGVDLFSTRKNRQENRFVTKQANAWSFDWHLLDIQAGPLWANPPFSKLEKVLTKVVLDKCRLVLCHPTWMGRGNERWSTLLDRLTIKRVTVKPKPNEYTYIGDDCGPLPSPTWQTELSLIDGSLMNKEDVDSLLVAWLERHNQGKELCDLEESMNGAIPTRDIGVGHEETSHEAAEIRTEVTSFRPNVFDVSCELPVSPIKTEPSGNFETYQLSLMELILDHEQPATELLLSMTDQFEQTSTTQGRHDAISQCRPTIWRA